MFTLACFVIGIGLMIPFEALVTRIVGVTALFAFIVSGVFLIADPDFLGVDEDWRARRRRASPVSVSRTTRSATSAE